MESVIEDEERKMTIMDFVADDSLSSNPKESYIDIIRSGKFKNMLSVLNERELLIIKMQYGFESGKKQRSKLSAPSSE